MAIKGYKNLSVSPPINAVALTLENIKESKKKKKKKCVDSGI